ncbi:hypothetical protein TNCV_3534431 [Trichonephila clavipes]|nr:hypothetical protein TNCV_3534431 [Trichonephila clavipes]
MEQCLGSPVVKDVVGLWLGPSTRGWRDMRSSPSVTENSRCRGADALYIYVVHCPPIGMVWKFGEELTALGLSPSIDHGSKLRIPFPIALVLPESATF